MRTAIILVILALASVSAMRHFDHIERGNLFHTFIVKHNKHYENEDVYVYRHNVFMHNMEKIYEHQEMNPEAVYGMTQFSDLTEDEFISQYLGYKNEDNIRTGKEYVSANVQDIPDSYDWRDQGAVTPVKNQGQCGSCWAFSTTGNLEGANQIKHGSLVSLSEQQLVDCDTVDAGCNGGLMDNAFDWLKANGGLEADSDYPYKGIDGKCTFDSSKAVVQVGDHYDIPVGDENAMKEAIFVNGPLSIAIHANGLQFYIGGIFNPVYCSKALNHGVLGVAYGHDDKKNLDFFTIKNSWGAAWGEKGYFQIVRGKNKCGIANASSHADVQ